VSDVRERLERASQGLAEVDLTDRVWADAYRVSRRRRRRTMALCVLAAVALVAAAIAVEPRLMTRTGRIGDDLLPSPVQPTEGTTLPPDGTLAGLPYWIAPPPGTEASLERLETRLGERLEAPSGDLPDLRARPVSRVGAVLLRQVSASHYQPVVLSARGRWATAEVDLLPVRDAAGNESEPLTTTAVSPAGTLVAFPQPDAVVVLDTTTGTPERIALPHMLVRNVAWMPSGDTLLASGASGTVLVVPGITNGQQVFATDANPDPFAATPPMALDAVGGREALVRFDPDGHRHAQLPADLPVRRWSGATFTVTTLAARAFVPAALPELQRLGSGVAMVAVVDARSATAGALLAMPGGDTGTRPEGCCDLLGWYDDHTVLLESRSVAGDWILAWDIWSGHVLQVAGYGGGAVALGQLG
jgi:hypothetical protein